MTPERFTKLKSVLSQRQTDLTVLLEGVHKPHNLAAISRSCDATGVLNLHAVVCGDRVLARRPKASAGSRRWVKTRAHLSSEEAFKALRKQGHNLIIAHPGETSLPYTEYDYTQPTAVVFGSELDGLSDHAKTHCDGEIYIPMIGLCESLNVSVSAALVLYEAKRQRHSAGLYDQCRLKPQQFADTLFEWCHPRLAHYCRERKIPYPEIDVDSGEIISDLPGTVSNPKRWHLTQATLTLLFTLIFLAKKSF